MATISTTAGRSGLEHSKVERYRRRRRVLLVDYALGVAGFVTKPFDPAALAALLTGVLDRATAA